MTTVVDSYGIELIHPWREGRSPQQLGQKGKSNYTGVKDQSPSLQGTHLLTHPFPRTPQHLGQLLPR